MSKSRLQSDAWKDAEEAIRLFQQFHAKKVRSVFHQDFLWPEPQTIKGIAYSCSYRSDKWMEDGHHQDYIHHHKHRPFPYVICQAKKGDEIMEDPVLEPDPPAFAILGRALDYEFHEPDIERQERKHNPPLKENFLVKRGKLVPTEKLPYMAAVAKELLVIFDPNKPNQPATLIWSPRLIVTPRGIER